MAKTTTHPDYTATGLTITTAAQPNITSLGTLTSLTVSGDAAFDTDTLFVDVSADRVGINQSSPSHALHIIGGDNDEARVRVHNSASGQASLDLDNSEGYFRTFTDAGEYRIYDQTDGAYRLLIDTSGNVGIGTSSPKEKLDVSGAGVFTGDHATGTNAYGAAQGIMIHASSSTGYVTAVSNGSNNVDLQLRGLNSGAANANQLVLDSSGKVGIGTASPATDLEVEGSSGIRVGDGTGYAKIYGDSSEVLIGAGSSDPLYIITNNTKRMLFTAAGKTLMSSEAQSTSQSVGGAEPKVQQIGNNSSRSQYALGRFTSNSAGPEFKFLKSRDSTIGSNTIVQSGDKLGMISFYADDGTDYASEAAMIKAEIDATPGANDTPGRLVFQTAADGSNSTTERMRIDSSGNVGIGTSSPSRVLDVEVSSDNAIGSVVSGTSSIAGFVFGDTGADDQGGVLYNNNGDYQYFRTGGAERLRIDSSGNVGFNTTNLAIASSGGTTGNSTATPNRFCFNNNYSNGYTDASLKLYLFNENATRQGFTSGPAYDLQYHSSGSDAGRHAFYVANSEIMRINKTQVGIGDSSQISNNTTTTLAVRKDTSAGRGGEISIVNYAAVATGNEAALNFGLEGSTYHNNDGNAQIKARVTGSDAATDMHFSLWSGSSFKERARIRSQGTFYVSADLGAHSGTYSYAHNTYAHAAVFGANSVPDGSVVIEDYDVSSGIGNTVLKLFLRDQDPATSAVFLDFSDGGGRVGSVTHNDDGGGVSFNTTSDYRLKENVNYTWNALSLLNQLKPAKFNFKTNPSQTIQGMLAHEVMDIVPSSVRGAKDHMEPIGTIKDSKGSVIYEGVYEHFTKTDEGQTWEQTGTEPVYQELDYSRLVPLLTKALQEADDKIDALEARITALEG